jgi:hypothetical protein
VNCVEGILECVVVSRAELSGCSLPEICEIQAFQGVKIQVEFFWIVTAEDGGSKVLRNVGIVP